MDFSFLNALTRATTLPPPEPWFSGSTAALHLLRPLHRRGVRQARATSTPASPSISASRCSARSPRWPPSRSAAPSAGGAASACWPALFVVLIGNLAGLRELIAPPGGQLRLLLGHLAGHQGHHQRVPVLELPVRRPARARAGDAVLAHLPGRWRCGGCARDEAPAPVRRDACSSLLLGLLLGAIMVTNGWSSPTYVLFLPFLLGCVRLARGPLGRGRIAALIVLALLAGAVVVLRAQLPALVRTRSPCASATMRASCTPRRYSASPAWPRWSRCPPPPCSPAPWSALAYALYLPFWRDFSAPPRNFGLQDQSRRFLGLRQHLRPLPLHRHSVPVRPLAAQPAGAGAPAPRCRAQRWPCGWWRSPSAAAGCSPCPPSPDCCRSTIRGSLRIGLAAVAVLAFYIALQRPLTSLAARGDDHARRSPSPSPPGTDVVYVWDRMNTIFKFYLEAWFLLAAAERRRQWSICGRD